MLTAISRTAHIKALIWHLDNDSLAAIPCPRISASLIQIHGSSTKYEIENAKANKKFDVISGSHWESMSLLDFDHEVEETRDATEIFAEVGISSIFSKMGPWYGWLASVLRCWAVVVQHYGALLVLQSFRSDLPLQALPTRPKNSDSDWNLISKI